MSQAPLDSPIQIALPQTAQGMPRDLQPHFQDLYDAIYQLQLAFVNYAGVAAQPRSVWSQIKASSTVLAQNGHRTYLQATETILTGAMVNVFLSGGAAKVQNAGATTGAKPCHGYCNVVGGGIAGNFLEIIMFEGLCTLFSGLTPGTEYFLSTVPGSIQTAKPVAAGNIEQFLGVALDANSFFFNSHYRIQH
jgi:hypothetical protein